MRDQVGYVSCVVECGGALVERSQDMTGNKGSGKRVERDGTVLGAQFWRWGGKE